MSTVVRRIGARWRALPVALQAFLASRALVLALVLLFSLTIGQALRGPDPGVPDVLVLARMIDPATPAALVLLGDWDTVWYLDIARHGYALDSGQVGVDYTNLAFFPLVPGIMGAFLLVGINPFFGALVVANLGFLGALWGLGALGRRVLGDHRLADLSVWAFAMLPPAIYVSMAYTEGVVLVCAIAAALCALRGRVALAGLVAAPAALARPTGALAAVLVVLLAWSMPAEGPRALVRRLGRVVVAAGPSAALLVGFFTWMWIARGDPTLGMQAQAAWARGQVGIGIVTAMPGEIWRGTMQVVRMEPGTQWTSAVRDVGFTALYLWLLVGLWRGQGGLRSPWVQYSGLSLAIPLSTGSFASMSRFGLLAFPLMWPLARWLDVSARRRRWALLAAIVLMVMMVAQLRIRAP